MVNISWCFLCECVFYKSVGTVLLILLLMATVTAPVAKAILGKLVEGLT